jgi:hypothetical protein
MGKFFHQIDTREKAHLASFIKIRKFFINCTDVTVTGRRNIKTYNKEY